MTTLVLIDDHDLVRESLAEKLGACDDLEVLADAACMEEGLAKVREHKPDVLLLDLRLKDGSGLQMIEPIKKISPGTRIIILTMYDHPRYAMAALNKGAEGFVLKGTSFQELRKAINAVRANKSYVAPELAARLVGNVGGKNRNNLIDTLSPREFEVVILVGQGYPLKEVASILNINEKSVSTYLSRLMDKLHLESRTDLIRFVLEEGLLE